VSPPPEVEAPFAVRRASPPGPAAVRLYKPRTSRCFNLLSYPPLSAASPFTLTLTLATAKNSPSGLVSPYVPTPVPSHHYSSIFLSTCLQQHSSVTSSARNSSLPFPLFIQRLRARSVPATALPFHPPSICRFGRPRTLDRSAMRTSSSLLIASHLSCGLML